MNIGKNIQHLRKQKRITQEQLAESMSVSRQTVSRWEAGEIVPELNKLIALSELFSCKLDALVNEDLAVCDATYSEVTIKQVKAFQMARYVIISPQPENDVNAYMRRWARQSGLLERHPEAMLIGWDFPYVPPNSNIGLGFADMWRPIFCQRTLKRTAQGWSMPAKKRPSMRSSRYMIPLRLRLYGFPMLIRKSLHFYRQMVFVRSRRRRFSPVLSMYTKKMESLVWMCMST